MKMIKNKIKGIIIALTASVILSAMPGLTSHTFAEEPQPQESTFEEVVQNLPEAEDTPVDAKTTEDILQDVSKMAIKSHRLFAPLINLFAFQIGNFLGHDYVYQGNMGKMLQNIWVVTRNLVNIAFVFLLLWIAIKTIFLPESGIDELKKSLVKFALLLVAVNFSWLGTKVVLDASSVVTHIIFSIPSGIGTPPSLESQECQVNTNDENPIKGLCYPTTIIAPADAGTSRPLYWQDKEGDEDDCAKVKKAYYEDLDSAYHNQDGALNPLASDQNKKFQKRTSICMENLNFFKYDQNTAVIYLTYGMARIQNLVNANTGGDAIQLSVGVLLSVIIQIAYTIALGALLFVLIFRMLMLWILVAFSPLLVLAMWFEGGLGSVSENFSMEVFLNWAFVPAKVGAVFTIAFIMISAGQSLGDITTTAIDNLMTKSGFTYKLLEQKSLFIGMDSLQSFIWLLMTLVVLWLGVFSVLGKLNFIGGWLGSLGETGKNFAIQVASLPYIAPILPLGKGGQPVSAKSLVSTVNFADKVSDYVEANGGARLRNVSELSNRARMLNFERDFGGLMQVNPTDSQAVGIANQVASRLGFRNLEDLMKEDTKTVKEGLKKVEGIGKDGEERIYDAFTKIHTAQKKETLTAPETVSAPGRQVMTPPPAVPQGSSAPMPPPTPTRPEPPTRTTP